jgi:hypothetical protein
VGSNNTGFANLGSGNTGSDNLGSGNSGFANTGSGNTGFGFGNAGNGDIGFGNTGNGDIGFASTGNGNTGFGNTGNDNAALLAALHATNFLGINDAALKALAADNGTLQLDNSSIFAGTVAGMTGHETFDLADMDPGKLQPPSFSGNSLGGTLIATDGMHINVALLGNYMASVFVAQSDGHGGTAVTDPQTLGGVQPLVTAAAHLT